MRCCGHNVTTPFCPMCGKAFADRHPLGTLLLHVRTVLRRYKTRKENRESNNETIPGWLARGIEMWGKWEKALEEVLENADVEV